MIATHLQCYWLSCEKWGKSYTVRGILKRSGINDAMVEVSIRDCRWHRAYLWAAALATTDSDVLAHAASVFDRMNHAIDPAAVRYASV